MSRSFRWRLVSIFGLVIALTVFLSGVFSLWATTDRFGVLVTEEDREQAEAIAPLLEANYAYWGNWYGLDELLAEPLAQETIPENIFVVEWQSQVDWLAVVADTLFLDVDTLMEYWEDTGDLATVAEQQDVAPEILVDAIMMAEQDAINAAVAEGILTPGQAMDKLAEIENAVMSFVWEPDDYVISEMADWDLVVIEELGIPEGIFYTAIEDGSSIAALSTEYGVAPENLINILVEVEENALRESGQLSEVEVAEHLQAVTESAWMFINSDFVLDTYPMPYVDEVDWTEAGVDWLLGSVLLGNNTRLLVADSKGWVVYDQAGTHTGQQLPDTMLEQGVPLWDRVTNELAGTLIVTAGAGYYNAHQSAFLRGVNRALVLSGILAGTVALTIGLLVAQRVTAPVVALTEATQRMSHGDWSTRVPVYTSDELGQMSAAFNMMAESLEVQQELRNRMVNDVAHELNTPLSVIQVELEALKDHYQTPEEAATHVEREITLLRDLVNDLALLAEADEGRLQLTLENVDLTELVAQAIERWQPQAAVGGITLQMLLLDKPLPPVVADPLRIAQVLGNLIANALQHTPSGGTVELHCACDLAAQHICTTITDTGTGIPAADLPYIFERFYRSDKSRSRRTGGRGLGLVVVQSLVEAHGGRIWVESSPDKGTIFRFTLPLARS